MIVARMGQKAFFLFTSLILASVVPGCNFFKKAGTGDSNAGKVSSVLTPNVFASVNGAAVTKISDQKQIESLQFLSHSTVKTWEGLATKLKAETADVHIVDTNKFEGHFGYAQNGLGLGSNYTQNQFFAEIQFPKDRIFMPFLVFDFRDKPLSWQGKSFKWVLNIRRYNYRDTDLELADLLVRMKTLVGANLMKGHGEPLIQVYTTPNSFRRPHINNLTEVHKKGLMTITEEQMITAAGAKLVSVLNPGVAVGYLKLVKAGETVERLTPRHIAIFEDTPERIPPVSGIITLEPQTPLSHVNLLAKNRGTLNISASSMSDLPELKDLVGELVRLLARADGTYTLTKISAIEAGIHWDSQKKFALEVPPLAATTKDLVTFADWTAPGTSNQPANQLVNAIGAKASNYAFIQKALGTDLVKPAFGLGFSHYQALAAETGAQALINDLIGKKKDLTPEEIDKKLTEIRDLISAAKDSNAIKATAAEVRKAITKMPGVVRIRMRSSTNSEDLPLFNGAGLYESQGFNVVDVDDKLIKKLLFVMSSLWLERAFWEREFFGIKHQDVAMAILVSPAFSAEFGNGVVVGTSEANDAFKTWVNVQKGEASVTNPLEGEIPESFTFLNEDFNSVAVMSRSNIGTVFLEDASNTLRSSLRPQLLQLKAATQTLQKLFVERQRAKGDNTPYGIDIEYKLMEENGAVKLHIKQSRLLNLAAQAAPDEVNAVIKLVAKKNEGQGGAHLRTAPKQLSELTAPKAFCFLPENRVIGVSDYKDVGNGYVRVNIVNPSSAPGCESFEGEAFIFFGHFGVVP